MSYLPVIVTFVLQAVAGVLQNRGFVSPDLASMLMATAGTGGAYVALHKPAPRKVAKKVPHVSLVFLAALLSFACASNPTPAPQTPAANDAGPVASLLDVDPLYQVLDFCAKDDPQLAAQALQALNFGKRLTAIAAAVVMMHAIQDKGGAIPAEIMALMGDAFDYAAAPVPE